MNKKDGLGIRWIYMPYNPSDASIPKDKHPEHDNRSQEEWEATTRARWDLNIKDFRELLERDYDNEDLESEDG